MPNQLKARLKLGQACINGWSLIPSNFCAEVFAQAGWDSITFDLQHGLHDYRSAIDCIQAIQSYEVTPLVRVPWNEPGIIGKVLDGGAWGVICPMINSQADAGALVRACHYPPLGQRSFGPVRASRYGGRTAYLASANQEILVLPQVETREAVENIEAILDVEGVSGVYVGPSDLGISLGLPATFDREEPVILEIYHELVAQTARRGLVAAMHNSSPAYAARMIEMGFRLITVANDMALLGNSSRETVLATRKAAGLSPV